MILNIFILVFCSCFGVSLSQSSCRTPNGEIAHCVSIYDCKIFLNVLKSNNLTPQITNFLRESKCEEENFVKVCCGSYYNYEDASSNRYSNNEISNEECGKFDGDKYAGKMNILKINEYPWVALIEYRNNKEITGHHCGGVLINKDFVLTAAHCVFGDFISQFGDAYQIRLGEYDRSTENDCVDIINGTYTCYDNHQNVGINKIFVHPEYIQNNGKYINDIALIKLSNSVTYNDFIRPVCLTTESISPAGTEYFVVGWGINKNSESQTTKHLVKALAFTNEHCNKIKPENITLSSSQFCAVKSGAQEKKQYCGDSGGAIIKQINHQNNGTLFVLQGIESFNFNENIEHQNYIIVYTKISEYVNWILKSMQL